MARRAEPGRPAVRGCQETRLPGLVPLELHFCLQLLLPHARLFGLALLLQQKGRPLLGKLIFGFLFILQTTQMSSPSQGWCRKYS